MFMFLSYALFAAIFIFMGPVAVTMKVTGLNIAMKNADILKVGRGTILNRPRKKRQKQVAPLRTFRANKANVQANTESERSEGRKERRKYWKAAAFLPFLLQYFKTEKC